MSQAINTDVTVSQELRDLLSDRGRPPKVDPVSAPVVGLSVLDAQSATLPAICHVEPEWGSIRLRRDGQRPLCFVGMPVVRFCGSLTLDTWDCQQEVALYVSKCKKAYVALGLHLPAHLPQRPLFRCIAAEPETFQSSFEDWVTCVTAHAPFASLQGERRLDNRLSFIKRFHEITAHCFQAKPASAERKDRCLQ